jgi:fumarate hydratase class II
MLPVIGRNLLESIRLLASVSRVFADKCVSGIEANVDQLKRYAESSPSIATSLNAFIGYDKAAKVVKESIATGKSPREVVLEWGLMTDAELDNALDVLAMTKGGIPKKD